MAEPECTGVEITVSTGGAVQIVKFNLRNDFGFAYTEKYTIPADWSAERVETWKATKTAAIKEKVDALAQLEQDALLESADWYGN